MQFSLFRWTQSLSDRFDLYRVGAHSGFIYVVYRQIDFLTPENKLVHLDIKSKNERFAQIFALYVRNGRCLNPGKLTYYEGKHEQNKLLQSPVLSIFVT